jgi:hypothetical protein
MTAVAVVVAAGTPKAEAAQGGGNAEPEVGGDDEVLGASLKLHASKKGLTAEDMANWDKICNRHGKKLTKMLMKMSEDLKDGDARFEKFVVLVNEKLKGVAMKSEVRADVSNLQKIMQMEVDNVAVAAANRGTAALSAPAPAPVVMPMEPTEGRVDLAELDARDRKIEKKMRAENGQQIQWLQGRVEALEHQCESQKLEIEELSNKSVSLYF